jgi:hypothetical protein
MPDLRAEGVAYLRGRWGLAVEHILAVENAGLAVVYEGSGVSAVLSLPDGEIDAVEIDVRLDGLAPAAEIAGADLDRSDDSSAAVVLCDRGGVYELLRAGEFGVHHLELSVRGPGLAVHLLHFGTTFVPEVA